MVTTAPCAPAALENGAAAKDVDFYTGKIAAAKWFAQNRLPLLAGERLAAETTNLEIMELSEDAF